uniref:U4/U6.U5 tri-snRNP-associated protein 1-like n=2 Tax=Hirondellea gigas TaxID=1518452 RepID=A0A6A7FT07_9CRUS
MGSSKKSKDKDRNREERKKRKHRSRSRSRDKERHHKHKRKKRSHRKEQEVREQPSRSRSPLSDVSNASSDVQITDTSYVGDVAAPPPPRISRAVSPPAIITPPAPPPPPSTGGRKGQKRGHSGSEGEEEELGGGGGSSSKRGRGVGGGWEDQQRPTISARAAGGGGGGGGGAAALSLSIDETNKIRAKLGLKPLQVDVQAAPKESEKRQDGEEQDVLAEGEKRMVEDSQEFIHKPAQNIGDKLQVEKLREKIAAQREKRRLKDKMSKMKTLGESDSDDDALAWVNKSRKLTKEKLVAEKKARQLEELDAEFGIGDLVEEEVAKDQRKAYGRNHLAGLKVQHHHSRFMEGSTILTLADSQVLGDQEDTLVNVNLLDLELAERNLERRRNKDDPEYEAPAVDENGMMLQSNLLTKYDEELHGLKKSSFRLGRRGNALVVDDSLQQLGEKQRKMAKLQQLHSLSNYNSNKLVQEYMTHDEDAATFKKPNKSRKKSKRLRADDLVPLEDSSEHHGSRNRRVDQDVVVEPGEDETDRIKTLRELMMEDQPTAMEEDLPENANYDEDEGLNDDMELQEALARSRKAKLAKLNQPKLEDLKQMLESNEPAGSSRDVDLSSLLADGVSSSTASGGLALNTTDEFCRTLGDIPTYGLSGNRAEDEQQNLQLLLNKAPVESPGASGAWEEVGIENTKVEISVLQSVPILDEEPDASKGVANALRLAIKKGYLEKSTLSKKGSTTLQHLRAINYSIDDKAGDDDRRGRGGGDRYGGPITEFKDKEGYKPKISLEYVDDEGRKLCPKEAFRYLSHKFHGKGSGKNKTEKRMKKWQEELLMKQMSSSDTPLQTLERQMEKQKQLGTSYLVLSGSKNQEPASAAETRIKK